MGIYIHQNNTAVLVGGGQKGTCLPGLQSLSPRLRSWRRL